MFLDLVQRSEVLPASVNASELFTDAASAADNPNQLLGTLSEHKEELMLQYIGVLTVAVCGVLASSMQQVQSSISARQKRKMEKKSLEILSRQRLTNQG